MPGSQRARFERNIEIPMRDGTVLRADRYSPDDDDPHPVLLNRTPYNKQGVTSFFDAIRAAGQGYSVIAQDCRGRYNSDGVFYPFLNETEDGYDTIEWLASQPWCTGKIGMFGPSYMGVTQWLAALGRPPHLTTIVPSITGSDYHNGWTYQSGAFLLGFSMSWTISAFAITNLAKIRPPAEEWTALRDSLIDALDAPGPSYSHFPLMEYPRLKHPGLAPYFYDWLDHPSEDEYWKRWKVSDFHEQLTIPVFNIGGWYDIFLNGTLANYQGMKHRAASEEARSAARLVVGPWFHGAPLLGQVSGELNFGLAASSLAYGLEDQVLRWFDYWLKGEENGCLDSPPVTVFTMGENRWRSFDQWPPEGAREVTWFLHSGGLANTLDGDGQLDTRRPADEPRDHFLYDPRDPVPTRGGGLCCGPTMSPGGAHDQRPIESRPDVLVYSSEPLEEDLEVSGPVRVHLWASSSAPDTDFTAKLVDVHPNGYAQNLIDNLVRARYRNSLEKPEPIEPNRAYEYTIDLFGTSNVFKAGHRVRIEVSSSNFPRFDRNTNTGGVIAADTEMRPALQTVLHDQAHPSALVLSIRPR